jgi:hypothetical protein
VRVTVTTSSNPLPWPIALLFTIVGAALIAAGFTVVPKLPEFDGSNTILEVVAAFLVVPAWIIFLVIIVRRLVRHDDVTGDIPDELEEAPSTHDASVVAVVIGDGRPGARAVAGTAFDLAARGDLSINEYGEKVVIEIGGRAGSKTECERLVLDGLRAEIGDDGNVTGPPIWKHEIGWWRDYVNDARKRASQAGLIETRIPFVALIIVAVFTATAFSLVFFERMPVFIGSILLANGLPHLIARGSGFRLTDAGRRMLAAWRAHGRYLHRHHTLVDAGPAGVTIWGPNLAYGAVLGVAEKAARPLTPDVEGFADERPASVTKVYDL